MFPLTFPNLPSTSAWLNEWCRSHSSTSRVLLRSYVSKLSLCKPKVFTNDTGTDVWSCVYTQPLRWLSCGSGPLSTTTSSMYIVYIYGCSSVHFSCSPLLPIRITRKSFCCINKIYNEASTKNQIESLTSPDLIIEVCVYWLCPRSELSACFIFLAHKFVPKWLCEWMWKLHR